MRRRDRDDQKRIRIRRGRIIAADRTCPGQKDNHRTVARSVVQLSDSSGTVNTQRFRAPKQTVHPLLDQSTLCECSV